MHCLSSEIVWKCKKKLHFDKLKKRRSHLRSTVSSLFCFWASLWVRSFRRAEPFVSAMRWAKFPLFLRYNRNCCRLPLPAGRRKGFYRQQQSLREREENARETPGCFLPLPLSQPRSPRLPLPPRSRGTELFFPGRSACARPAPRLSPVTADTWRRATATAFRSRQPVIKLLASHTPVSGNRHRRVTQSDDGCRVSKSLGIIVFRSRKTDLKFNTQGHRCVSLSRFWKR